MYIQEAHPVDLWQDWANLQDGVLLPSARTDGERSEAAESCVRKLGIRIPAILDGIGNRTEKAYTAWPDRLYLIARGGRVAFKSPAGPYGFSAGPLELALRSVAGP